MNLIEIPFSPGVSHGWTMPIFGDGEKQFSSGGQALAFAQTLAKDATSDSGPHSCLCVEGADGRWRLFSPDLLPVKAPG